MSRAEAPCVKRRVVESTDAVHFHVGTTRIRSRHVVHGSWTALAGPAPLRRRRRAEMLVGGHVRCDCERHGTLIENRSTTVDAQGARLQRSSCDRGPATKCATSKWSAKKPPVSTAHPSVEIGLYKFKGTFDPQFLNFTKCFRNLQVLWQKIPISKTPSMTV